MSTHRLVFVTCDECGNSAGIDDMHPTAAAARRSVQDELGWARRTVNGKRVDLCGDCLDALEGAS